LWKRGKKRGTIHKKVLSKLISIFPEGFEIKYKYYTDLNFELINYIFGYENL
jgi:hypothetical protein